MPVNCFYITNSGENTLLFSCGRADIICYIVVYMRATAKRQHGNQAIAASSSIQLLHGANVQKQRTVPRPDRIN